MCRHLLLVIPVLVIASGLASLLVPYGHPSSEGVERSIPASTKDAVEPILPLPALPVLSAEWGALGERLFRDQRISANQPLACVSCHDLTRGGADARPFSVGIGGAVGKINAPSIFNSGLSLAQFWDGRVLTLHDLQAMQIDVAIDD